MSGSVVSPAAWAAAKKNTAVSSPSRPTASAAMTTTAVDPIWMALSRRPRSSAEMERAARRIQKIIQVTKPTAMIERPPPNASCASNVSACWARVNASVTPTLTATAIATPSHTFGSYGAAPGTHQERNENAHHQGGFEAFPEADQGVSEQWDPLLRTALLGQRGLNRTEGSLSAAGRKGARECEPW